MKNLTLLLLLFLYGNALTGQSSEDIYKDRCSQLDLTKIKTSFLADYQSPVNNIYLLNGDIYDTISLFSFKQLYFDLLNY